MPYHDELRPNAQVDSLTVEQGRELLTRVLYEMREVRRLTRSSPLVMSREAIEARNVKLGQTLDRLWELMPDKEEKT
jgi:hypothetical protein